MRSFRRCALPLVPASAEPARAATERAHPCGVAGGGFAGGCRAAERWSSRPALSAFNPSFIGGLHTVAQIGETVPGNGDVNPYGIVVVPRSSGELVRNDVLISNFNDEENLQGTGTTIVELSPSGSLTLFSN